MKRVVGRDKRVVSSEESGEALVVGHRGIVVSFLGFEEPSCPLRPFPATPTATVREIDCIRSLATSMDAAHQAEREITNVWRC